MIFNSLEFLAFFVCVTSIFFLLPHRFRWMLLLAASCFFYMFFKPVYILILFFTIVIDYAAGILMERSKGKVERKSWLVMSIIANLLVLAAFKYYNFLGNNINGLFSLLHIPYAVSYLNIILPIGLSFHTFQAMSYTIEVYRGNQRAEKHFGIYSLYVMFYPQLAAGPIERPQHMLHQFYERKYFSYDNMVSGLNFIALGLFKKIVIADRLAVYVNQVYGHLDQSSSINVLLAVVFFAFQIYCDFSGYSDIARGTARCMGFELMVNFERPFLSASITEFWRRWHISLSTWFNDYLFTPLVIEWRNLEKWGVVLALLCTFAISGLWHGAGWGFVVYGLLHGIAVSIEFITKRTRKKIAKKAPVFLYNAASIFLTFVFVSLAWVFFRAENISQAIVVFQKMFSFTGHLDITQISAGKGPFNLILSFFAIGLLFVSYKLPASLKLKHSLAFQISIIFLITIFGKNGSPDFIYFQF